MTRSRATWPLVVATVVLTGSVGLLAAEALLRVTGHRPWRYPGLERIEPRTNDPDPVLGWRSRPGRYRLPAYSPGGARARVRIGPDGTRATGQPVRPGADPLWLLGGSFTEGWAVSDSETFAAALARRFPELEVRNFGALGYGTYQSLLLLERELERSPPPRLVLYGLIQDHERRNVAAAEWLYTMELFSERGTVRTPFATLGAESGIRRHPPRGYPRWPLRGWLASVAFAEQVFNAWTAAGRETQATEVTLRLIGELAARARERGARLAVVALSLEAPRDAFYRRALAERGIGYVGCAVDWPLAAEWRVAGEGHPNARLHARWAECVAAAIAPWIEGG